MKYFIGISGLVVVALVYVVWQSHSATTSIAESQQKEQVCNRAASGFFSDWQSNPGLSNDWAQAIKGSGGQAMYTIHSENGGEECFVQIVGPQYKRTGDGYYLHTFVYDVYNSTLLGYLNSDWENEVDQVVYCESPLNPSACASVAEFNKEMATHVPSLEW